jgi:ribosomal protein S4
VRGARLPYGVRAPERSEISARVDEQLIVEFYSRR